ncbi:glycosyltransferase family 4 protein [Janthinobacterium sp. B9-8]|uniref:glycosyltransferase family 4 protein n=1 Tax=Janthinobacterium sp. B9-8 TaxID=1236179 RepID=UPI00061CF626|nr:glycosyltransferase family 1 protein [Janthinobacterium sp. B9-8]AMC36760.1 hypothetical protein VN23_20290 [Janthinobacterium sp. B9-8]
MIYINGRFLSQRSTGVQRFSLQLLIAFDLYLDEINDLTEYTLLCPCNAIPPVLKRIKLKYVGWKIKGHLWEQLVLPFWSSFSILLNFSGAAPLFKIKQFITIHDSALYEHPSAYTALFRLWYKFCFSILKRTSIKIFTVSNFSKERLAYFLKIEEGKVKVLYNACDHMTSLVSDDSILYKFNLKPRTYSLAVGSLNPTKNISKLIEAMEFVNLPIVIAGGGNSGVFSQVDLNSNENTKIIYTGYITDEMLKSLYENALFFVFPSIYEGFGIPPLEAMSCGCPVVASNSAAIPEVCGDAALYFDPLQPNAIARTMNELSYNNQLREQLILSGNERVKQFKWSNTARMLHCELNN